MLSNIFPKHFRFPVECLCKRELHLTFRSCSRRQSSAGSGRFFGSRGQRIRDHTNRGVWGERPGKKGLMIPLLTSGTDERASVEVPRILAFMKVGSEDKLICGLRNLIFYSSCMNQEKAMKTATEEVIPDKCGYFEKILSANKNGFFIGEKVGRQVWPEGGPSIY